MRQPGRLSRLGVIAGSAILGACVVAAQEESPPPEFADLYTFLGQKLSMFDTTLNARWNSSRIAVCFATELLTANGNRGRQLLAAQTLVGARLELDRLHALGIGAATVAIPFPILYQPFLSWNGDPGDQQALVSFFATVVDEAHARGMKLVVENGPMFPGVYSSGSGMNAAGYYTTLSADQFIAGRATQVATIVRDIKPDLLNAGSEPDTEYRLTGQAFLRSPTLFAGMVRTFTEQLAAAGLTEVPIVAGSGTWMYQADSYVDALCAIDGLWGIDLHLYPINLNFLDQALALADIAHAHGKHVTMLEAWLQKERDSELSTMAPAVDPTVYARDTYSFWAPLDQEFLALLAKLAQVERMDYVSPFWSRYFFAYLDYDMVMQTSPPLTAAQVVTLATTAEAQALVAGEYTSTGLAYGALVSGRLVHRHLRH